MNGTTTVKCEPSWEEGEEAELNACNSVSQVWVKQETNDLDPEINGKLTSYLEKDQYKGDEINKEQEPVLQMWVKQESKQEPHDPSQASDEQKLQSGKLPDSSNVCKAEYENVETGDGEEGDEETVHEQKPSVSDLQVPLETLGTKYCCRQNMLLGKSCDICRKPFNVRKEVYECEVCSKRFINKYRLRTHLLVHEDRKFQCDICLKLFVNQLNLDKHKQLMQCRVRKFLCTICGKRFYTSSNLKGHSVNHSDERNYRCSICNKLFKHQRNLVQHQVVHT